MNSEMFRHFKNNIEYVLIKNGWKSDGNKWIRKLTNTIYRNRKPHDLNHTYNIFFQTGFEAGMMKTPSINIFNTRTPLAISGIQQSDDFLLGNRLSTSYSITQPVIRKIHGINPLSGIYSSFINANYVVESESPPEIDGVFDAAMNFFSRSGIYVPNLTFVLSECWTDNTRNLYGMTLRIFDRDFEIGDLIVANSINGERGFAEFGCSLENTNGLSHRSNRNLGEIVIGVPPENIDFVDAVKALTLFASGDMDFFSKKDEKSHRIIAEKKKALRARVHNAPESRFGTERIVGEYETFWSNFAGVNFDILNNIREVPTRSIIVHWMEH